MKKDLLLAQRLHLSKRDLSYIEYILGEKDTCSNVWLEAKTIFEMTTYINLLHINPCIDSIFNKVVERDKEAWAMECSNPFYRYEGLRINFDNNTVSIIWDVVDTPHYYYTAMEEGD